MNLTNQQLQQIIKEELDTIMSERMGSDEGTFIAAYRAHLMNQGEQDVTVATTAAEQALEVLKNTDPIFIEAAIDFISSKNVQAREDYVANNPSSPRKQYRPPPVGPSPFERRPELSLGDE